METTTALSSEPFLSISLVSMQEFLRMESTDAVKEVDLVRALIKWGKFQLQKDGDKFDGKNLRVKILPCLNLIRFFTLTTKEFASLCLEELGAVLSAEEKHSIMMAIVTEDSSLMPPVVVMNNYPARKRSAYITCKLPYGGAKIFPSTKFLNNSFYLVLKKKANFQGLMLNRPEKENNIFTLVVKNNYANETTWMGSLKKDHFAGEAFYKICPALSLDANINYTLAISHPFMDKIEMHATMANQRFNLTSNGLMFGTFLAVQNFSIVEAILFKETFQ
jgi:hypothetical protein